MSSTTMSPTALNASRPKIHRPPGIGARKKSKKPLPGFLVFWAGVLIALVALSLSIKKEPVIKAATMLPAVAVDANRIETKEALPAAAAHEESYIPAPISDAQAAPAVAPNAPAGKTGTTIMLKDQSGAIVGQMARIPLENEQITEVKAINEVDNRGVRELLSIVGKY